MNANDLSNAIRVAIEKVGSEVQLAKISGVTRARINNIKNGNIDLHTIKIGTLHKIFPEMQIDFFGTGKQKAYIGKIVSLLNNLSDSEHQEIYASIIKCYPHSFNSKMTQTLINKAV